MRRCALGPLFYRCVAAALVEAMSDAGRQETLAVPIARTWAVERMRTEEPRRAFMPSPFTFCVFSRGGQHAPTVGLLGQLLSLRFPLHPWRSGDPLSAVLRPRYCASRTESLVLGARIPAGRGSAPPI